MFEQSRIYGAKHPPSFFYSFYIYNFITQQLASNPLSTMQFAQDVWKKAVTLVREAYESYTFLKKF